MVYLQSPYLSANENFERSLYDGSEKESLLVPEQDNVRFYGNILFYT